MASTLLFVEAFRKYNCSPRIIADLIKRPRLHHTNFIYLNFPIGVAESDLIHWMRSPAPKDWAAGQNPCRIPAILRNDVFPIVSRLCMLRACDEIRGALCCRPPGLLARRERRAYRLVCKERTTQPASLRAAARRGVAAGGHLLRCRSSTMSPHRLRRGALHLPARRSRQSASLISSQALMVQGHSRCPGSVYYRSEVKRHRRSRARSVRGLRFPDHSNRIG
jgi:hypothetical protein